MAEIKKIREVSDGTKLAIKLKSAQTLPTRPSELGYSADEIKRRFYQPILDTANSALTEIDRIINEANISLYQVEETIGELKINAPYKVDLDSTKWEKSSTSGGYEFFITKEKHLIEDYREIDVNMFLIDVGGKLVKVNQFDIYTDGNVRLYNDNLGGGFVTISRNRDGFVRQETKVAVDNIEGLAEVAKTNSYEDLDDKPDLASISANELTISKIINGTQSVGSAEHADKSDSATYATGAGNAETANYATSANRAIADENGKNIAETYAEKTGTYDNFIAGKAKQDEEGNDIKTTYAKIDGTYEQMNVGNADYAARLGEVDIGSLEKPVYLDKGEAKEITRLSIANAEAPQIKADSDVAGAPAVIELSRGEGESGWRIVNKPPTNSADNGFFLLQTNCKRVGQQYVIGEWETILEIDSAWGDVNFFRGELRENGQRVYSPNNPPKPTLIFDGGGSAGEKVEVLLPASEVEEYSDIQVVAVVRRSGQYNYSLFTFKTGTGIGRQKMLFPKTNTADTYDSFLYFERSGNNYYITAQKSGNFVDGDEVVISKVYGLF